jgi:hypothetical protein
MTALAIAGVEGGLPDKRKSESGVAAGSDHQNVSLTGSVF